jgi:hypothetical protein
MRRGRGHGAPAPQRGAIRRNVAICGLVLIVCACWELQNTDLALLGGGVPHTQPVPRLIWPHTRAGRSSSTPPCCPRRRPWPPGWRWAPAAGGRGPPGGGAPRHAAARRAPHAAPTRAPRARSPPSSRRPPSAAAVPRRRATMRWSRRWRRLSRRSQRASPPRCGAARAGAQRGARGRRGQAATGPLWLQTPCPPHAAGAGAHAESRLAHRAPAGRCCPPFPIATVRRAPRARSPTASPSPTPRARRATASRAARLPRARRRCGGRRPAPRGRRCRCCWTDALSSAAWCEAGAEAQTHLPGS